MDIYKVPNLLVIHLKRFSHSMFYNRAVREKIDTDVDFPLDGLDMSPWVIDLEARSRLRKGRDYAYVDKSMCIYDCFAVSNHMGSTRGGHYTAYARSIKKQKWYCL